MTIRGLRGVGVGVCVSALAVLAAATAGGCSSSSSGSSSSSSSGASGASGSSSGTSGASGSSGTSGASGSSGAAPTCANYCTTMAAQCTGANQQYISDTGCQAVCSTLPLGAASDTGGQDSVGCRTYHAGNTPAATHCPHAGAFGEGICGDHCAAFCEVALKACATVPAPPFPDAATCKAQCAAWTRATPTVDSAQPTAGNTFDCRAWHLLKATDSPANLAAHCPHTADTSTVCK